MEFKICHLFAMIKKCSILNMISNIEMSYNKGKYKTSNKLIETLKLLVTYFTVEYFLYILFELNVNPHSNDLILNHSVIIL